MTELVRNWLLSVTGAAMVLALAEGLAPEGSVKKICRLAGGLVLVLAAMGPVLKLYEVDLTELTGRYEVTAQEYQEKLELEQDFLYESIIAENTAAYILDKAEGLGIVCQVSVTVERAQDGVPQPYSVRITGSLTEQQRSALSQILASDLGIPDARHYYEENK